MGQDESREADRGQTLMTQILMDRQNNVVLAVKSMATGCQCLSPASDTYELCDFKVHS